MSELIIKALIGLPIVGITGALVQPTLAQAAGMEPLTGWQQLGVCGGLLATIMYMLHWWTPRIVETATKHQAESMKNVCTSLDGVCEELKGVRVDWKEDRDEHFALLKDSLANNNNQ